MYHDIPNKEELAAHGYENLQKIGQGAFCYVYSAEKLENKNRYPVAIKIILHTNRGIDEAHLLKSLNHKFIIKYHEHIFIDKRIHIVTELCEYSDLEEHLHVREMLFEPSIKTMISHMVQALTYLKYKNICHFDIKPKNIFMTARPDLIYKLGDFGLSSVYRNGKTQVPVSVSCGTNIYMAPERLYKINSDFSCDIWSLGISMFQCLFDKPNVIREIKGKIYELLNSKEYFTIPTTKDISMSCHSLLEDLLKFNPKLRLSLIQILSHNFITTSIIPSGLDNCPIEKLCNKAIIQEITNRFHSAIKTYQKAQVLLTNHLLIIDEKDSQKIREMRNLDEDFRIRINQLKVELGNNRYLEELQETYARHYEDLKKEFCNHELGLQAIERAMVGEQLVADYEYWAGLDALNESLALFGTVLEEKQQHNHKDLLTTNINRIKKIVEYLRSIFEEDSG